MLGLTKPVVPRHGGEYKPLAMDDKDTQRAAQTEESTNHGYLRGLRASVGNNASAYGFSVTITAAFGLLTSSLGAPTAPEIFAFAVGAVAAFALVELVVSRGFKHGLEDEPRSVKELGSSISILSVGMAIACAYAVGRLVGASSPGLWDRSWRRRPTCFCSRWS